MTTHSQILELVKRTAPATFSELQGAANDIVLYYLLFSNLRHVATPNIKGFRLTKMGLKVLQPLYQNWVLTMEKDFTPKPCHLIFFDRTCTMPWFLDTRVLVLFEAQLA